jgi:hypothetical protein
MAETRKKNIFALEEIESSMSLKILTWIAVIFIFFIANFRPSVLNDFFSSTPPLPENMGFFAGFREIGFLTVSLIFLIVCWKSIRRNWKKSAFAHLSFKKMFLAATTLFFILATLAFPDPRAGTGGLLGMGKIYLDIAQGPFASEHSWLGRRLTMPVIAHYLHALEAYQFYIFSLAITFVLILLCLYVLETFAEGDADRKSFLIRCFVYLSLFTSERILTGFHRPGYCEQLGLCFLLPIFLVPMAGEARLALLALSLITHEGMLFVVVPLVWFCFPRRERWVLLALVLLAFFWGLSNRFEFTEAFRAQRIVDFSQLLAAIPIYWNELLLGLFFAHKLFWFFLFWIAGVAYKNGDRQEAWTMLSIGLSAIGIVVIVWDVSRHSSFGFLGLLFAVAYYFRISPIRKIKEGRLILAFALLNLLIPSYDGVDPNSGLYGIYNSFLPGR